MLNNHITDYTMKEQLGGKPSDAHDSDDDIDLGSYEGRYPKDLFNKSVVIEKADDRITVGHVQMEGQDTIVIFSDSGQRYDIPKSLVTVSGGSVVLSGDQDLESYRVDKDSQLPAAKSLRPSAAHIRRAAREQEQIEKTHHEEQVQKTRADMVLRERKFLENYPRPDTTRVSRPANYVDNESELSKKIKSAVAELRELLFAGAKVAKYKAKQAKQKADDKKAEMDADSISKMGVLAPQFSDAFEEILLEVRNRSYAEQEQIYNGFLRLMDYQRDLLVARRDMAARLKDTVRLPVVNSDAATNPNTRRKLKQKSQPALPERVDDPDESASPPRRVAQGKRSTRTAGTP